MPVTTAAASFGLPATTTPSNAGASRSSQPMSADPNVACCRTGSDRPAAWGMGTCSSVFVACSTPVVPHTRTTSSAARATRPARIDQAGATIAIAEAAARQARAISAVPAASRTSPLASQDASQSPRAAGGQSHQRGLPLKIPPAAASAGVPKVASSARACGPPGTKLMIATPAASSAAGTVSQPQLRPWTRACRAGAAAVAACAAQRTAYDGTSESVSSRRCRPCGRAPRAGSGCPRASRTSTTSPAARRSARG